MPVGAPSRYVLHVTCIHQTGTNASLFQKFVQGNPIDPKPTAGYWEPDEPRGLRPVLRERGGETPPRHSPRPPTQAVHIMAKF
jgi:hypothetical protein